MRRKTDNADLASKLALRRHFLTKYQTKEPYRVLDCCEGDGVIWGHLKGEFPSMVWGVDLKRKAGRLAIDSTRILAQPGWVFDVIDVDTYGSPWKHWKEILPRVTRPLTVFLTVGMGGSMNMNRNLSNEEAEATGLDRFKSLPDGISKKLVPLSVWYCIAKAFDHGLRMPEVVEAERGPRARYIGVRLEPQLDKH